MCIVSTVSSVRAVGNVSVRGVNKVKLRNNFLTHQRIHKFSYLRKTTGETVEAVHNIAVATDPSHVIIHTGTNNINLDPNRLYKFSESN